MSRLVILSYNIHKGFSSGIKKFTLHLMRDEIRKIHPDLVFIQEVHGARRVSSTSRKRRHESEIKHAQFEYLAHEIWPHYAYGKNAIYGDGHHGNAILSKYPIKFSENVDLSSSRIERRGLLHAAIEIPTERAHLSLDIFCTHLSLLERNRRKQLLTIASYVRRACHERPVILAGDFNDWRQMADPFLKDEIDLDEAFFALRGQNAKTFPSFRPMLKLDRIYFRWLKLMHARRLARGPWRELSDHVPIVAEFAI